MLKEFLRSLQLSGKKREGGFHWPGPQQLPVHTPQITMEIYNSDWIHKFQNKTGLDAKANSELYKSKRVCSVDLMEEGACWGSSVSMCVCGSGAGFLCAYNSLIMSYTRVTSHRCEVPDIQIWVQSKDDEAVLKLSGGSIWAIVIFVMLMVS